MINRFIETGKLINIDYFKTIGLKPKNNYNLMKGEFDAHARIDQEGPQGSEKSLNNQNKLIFDYDKVEEMAKAQANKLWKKMGHLL